MKREVVQNFLSLPGIAGVALMDGRSRPFFYGIDRTLNFQQKEALAQGIQLVVDTTPASFEFFEFQFHGQLVYIYKLNQGMILLVLVQGDLSTPDYATTIEALKEELQKDASNTIATFRLLAGNTTLSGQSYWKANSESAASEPAAEPNAVSPRLGATVTNPHASRTEPPALAGAPAASVQLKDVLDAMNQLSRFTTQYLGSTVVSNYWKTSRPAVEWLNGFQIERSAQITFVEPAAKTEPKLSAEQQQWVKQWVTAFIDRCSKVIRDFRRLIQQSTLSEQHKSLLIPD